MDDDLAGSPAVRAGTAPVQRTVAPRVWEVASLVQAVADALTARFAVVAVRGEVSSYTRASSGHCYFVVKDARGSAALRCVMFRRAAGLVDFDPQDGDAVELRGRLTVYEARGELQFVVESMQRSGDGALLERFLRLKAELEREGLFAASRKRPITAYPRCVAIVSSLGAAALHDVLTALSRRAPHVAVLIYPSLVQGAEAPRALAAAIDAAAGGSADTLLLVRGGGSIEDLWAFNEPLVVRAVAGAAVPVVAGVGHETDITLVDFAADVRAATPTAAAELAAMPQSQALAVLSDLASRLDRAVRARLDRDAQRLDRVVMRLAQPGQRLAMHRQRLGALQEAQARAAARRIGQERDRHVRLAQRLQSGAGSALQKAAHRADVLAARLGALDPALVLARGYAWLSDENGRTLSSVRSLAPGQSIEARLVDGRASARVTQVQPDAGPDARFASIRPATRDVIEPLPTIKKSSTPAPEPRKD